MGKSYKQLKLNDNFLYRIFRQWAVSSGQLVVGSGQWSMGSGQLAIGNGQWAVGERQPRQLTSQLTLSTLSPLSTFQLHCML
jgi:hypothetical protein